jgi:hypothetical protein
VLPLSDRVECNVADLQQLVSCAEDADLLLTTGNYVVKFNVGQVSVPCYQFALDLRAVPCENPLDELFQCLWRKEKADGGAGSSMVLRNFTIEKISAAEW